MSHHHFTSPKTLDEMLVFKLVRLTTAAGAPVVRLCEGRYGITRREWRLIVALAPQASLLSSELADRAMLTRARTSRAVSELVEKRLVTRTPRPHDRRLADIALTASGRRVYDELFPQAIDITKQLLADFSEQEVDLLDTLLTRLQQAADSRLAQGDLPKTGRQHRRRRVLDADD